MLFSAGLSDDNGRPNSGFTLLAVSQSDRISQCEFSNQCWKTGRSQVAAQRPGSRERHGAGRRRRHVSCYHTRCIMWIIRVKHDNEKKNIARLSLINILNNDKKTPWTLWEPLTADTLVWDSTGNTNTNTNRQHVDMSPHDMIMFAKVSFSVKRLREWATQVWFFNPRKAEKKKTESQMSLNY